MFKSDQQIVDFGFHQSSGIVFANPWLDNQGGLIPHDLWEKGQAKTRAALVIQEAFSQYNKGKYRIGDKAYEILQKELNFWNEAHSNPNAYILRVHPEVIGEVMDWKCVEEVICEDCDPKNRCHDCPYQSLTH